VIREAYVYRIGNAQDKYIDISKSLLVENFRSCRKYGNLPETLERKILRLEGYNKNICSMKRTYNFCKKNTVWMLLTLEFEEVSYSQSINPGRLTIFRKIVV